MELKRRYCYECRKHSYSLFDSRKCDKCINKNLEKVDVEYNKFLTNNKENLDLILPGRNKIRIGIWKVSSFISTSLEITGTFALLVVTPCFYKCWIEKIKNEWSNHVEYCKGL